MLWSRRWPWNPCAMVAPWLRKGVEVNPILRLGLVWFWEQVQLLANSCCPLGPASEPELLHGSHLRALHHSHHSGLYLQGRAVRGGGCSGARYEPWAGDGLEEAGNMHLDGSLGWHQCQRYRSCHLLAGMQLVMV